MTGQTPLLSLHLVTDL